VSSRKRLLRTIALFVLAYGAAFAAARLGWYVRHWIYDTYSDDWWLYLSMQQLYRLVAGVAGASYGTTLAAATVAAALGFVARKFARARVVAGLADPLDAVRAFFARSRAAARALAFVPAALWMAGVGAWQLRATRFLDSGSADGFTWLAVVGFVLPAGLAFVTQVALVRRGLRALLAPTVEGGEQAKIEMAADGFVFDAVAVTFETRAAIAAMAAFPFVFFVVMGALRHLQNRTFDLAMMGAYVALTTAGAAAFARASRISVGVDGVLVKGTSRRRFFAYGDIDGVKTSGTDIELRRGTRTVLRLQLHGKDVARREALAARIEQAITRAHAEREAPAVSFVASASSSELANVAAGGGDYRRSAISREELWSLVEGPASGSHMRRAAAEALAKSGDETERARLRVAVDNSANPALRDELAALLEEEEEEQPRLALRAK
jgi:hypothetical protein